MREATERVYESIKNGTFIYDPQNPMQLFHLTILADMGLIGYYVKEEKYRILK